MGKSTDMECLYVHTRSSDVSSLFTWTMYKMVEITLNMWELHKTLIGPVSEAEGLQLRRHLRLL